MVLAKTSTSFPEMVEYIEVRKELGTEHIVRLSLPGLGDEPPPSLNSWVFGGGKL